METKIKRALISVSDKLGLADLARGLVDAGVEIYSTGGTRKYLLSNGIEAVEVSKYTAFPEMMHGRLKTLHPKIFGGILARRNEPDDMQAAHDHQIAMFDLIVVNLYPFEATISRPGVTDAEAIENIDIGGPSLVRAAAKNHQFVTIATHPEQYSEVLEQIEQNGGTTLELRQKLAGEAFGLTAAYDRAIADYFAQRSGKVDFPPVLTVQLHRKSELRHGENPHQRAGLYNIVGARGVGLVTARQLNGKELSYNNILDLDAALGIVRAFSEPAAVVIKHNNPCGAAIGSDLASAAQRALAGDPQSAFGGIIGFNRPVDAATAEVLATPGLFIEAIVAPEFSPEALQILTTKPKWKQNVRLMQVGAFDVPQSDRKFRHIEGGMLVQDADVLPDPESDWKLVTTAVPSDALQADLRFAWQMVRPVKSNAIVIAKDGMLLGAGAGQMSRVDSVDIAIAKAGERVKGAVLASDAFFPFPDSIHKAAAAGIAAIIQTGGSVKDAEVIAACNEHGLPMILTGRRHFTH